MADPLPFPAPEPGGNPAQPEGSFAAWLAAELAARGWAAPELARRAGLHRTAVNHYLAGRRLPKARAGAALARALGVPAASVYRLAGADLPPAEGGRQRACALAAALPDDLLPAAIAMLEGLREHALNRGG